MDNETKVILVAVGIGATMMTLLFAGMFYDSYLKSKNFEICIKSTAQDRCLEILK